MAYCECPTHGSYEVRDTVGDCPYCVLRELYCKQPLIVADQLSMLQARVERLERLALREASDAQG